MGGKQSCNKNSLDQADGGAVSDVPRGLVAPPSSLSQGTGNLVKRENLMRAQKDFRLLKRGKEVAIERRRLDVIDRAKELDKMRHLARDAESQLTSLQLSEVEQRTAISQRRAELDSQLLLLKNKLEIQYLNPKPQGEHKTKWRESSKCAICLEQAEEELISVPDFNFSNRRHHCRRCGRSVCEAHSGHEAALPLLGLPTPVRQCESCFTEIRWAETLFSSMSFNSDGTAPEAKIEWQTKAKALGFATSQLQPALTQILDLQGLIARDRQELQELSEHSTAVQQLLQERSSAADELSRKTATTQAHVAELADELHEMELAGSPDEGSLDRRWLPSDSDYNSSSQARSSPSMSCATDRTSDNSEVSDVGPPANSFNATVRQSSLGTPRTSSLGSLGENQAVASSVVSEFVGRFSPDSSFNH